MVAGRTALSFITHNGNATWCATSACVYTKLMYRSSTSYVRSRGAGKVFIGPKHMMRSYDGTQLLIPRAKFNGLAEPINAYTSIGLRETTVNYITSVQQ